MSAEIPDPPLLPELLHRGEPGRSNKDKRLVKLRLVQQILTLYSQRVSAEEIAARLGIEKRRVYRAVYEAKREWAAQNIELFEAIRQRELLDLDAMERQAALEFSTRGRDPEWIKVRLAIKVFRARLVGLIGREASALAPQEGEIVVDLRFGDGKPA